MHTLYKFTHSYFRFVLCSVSRFPIGFWLPFLLFSFTTASPENLVDDWLLNQTQIHSFTHTHIHTHTHRVFIISLASFNYHAHFAVAPPIPPNSHGHSQCVNAMACTYRICRSLFESISEMIFFNPPTNKNPSNANLFICVGLHCRANKENRKMATYV